MNLKVSHCVVALSVLLLALMTTLTLAHAQPSPEGDAYSVTFRDATGTVDTAMVSLPPGKTTPLTTGRQLTYLPDCSKNKPGADGALPKCEASVKLGADLIIANDANRPGNLAVSGTFAKLLRLASMSVDGGPEVEFPEVATSTFKANVSVAEGATVEVPGVSKGKPVTLVIKRL